MDVLVTYDIDTTDDTGERRLRRVAHICERYGVRVQESVFECRLSETRLQRLLCDMTDVILPKLDSVHVYRFHGSLRASRQCLGKGVPHEPGDPWVL